MSAAQTKFSIAPLLAVNFVGTLGFSVVIPFMVALVTKWGGNAFIYAVIAATYSFFQLFGAPILGQWSDKVGRRKVLLLSQYGTLLSWCIFLLAFFLPATALADVNTTLLGDFTVTLPLLVLFLARAADGLTGGNVSVSNAYLADITQEKDRSKNFGQMAISSNLGFIIGPALAGLLAATFLGEILPVLAAMFISVAALFLIQFGLKEVTPATIDVHLEKPNACHVYGQEHKKAYKLECEQPNGVAAIFKLPNIPSLLSINFLVLLGFSFFYAAFPIYALQTLSWQTIDLGTYFAFLSFSMIVVQGPILSYLSRYLSDRVLMVAGGAILGCGFLTMLMPQTLVIYSAAFLIALGNGLMWPTFMSALSKSAGSQFQGAVQGYAGGAGAVASIVGLIVGGLVFVQFGAIAFAIGAGVIFSAALMAIPYNPATELDENAE